ncbi:hypothetical protein H5162_03590 [Pseudoalteromonas sp. SR41-8]|uniref:hypothetical protein n=1 Tax=Pseudoalteromonas sp. SR41-8 TaxID=2760946 RepID=UPI001603862D|nr:hypothetical protein [Pseudoalteromonas sp. SR41-8]MBB1308526.1 hypothetical protein [Pseudoalteromonas sp. SR41-8]
MILISQSLSEKKFRLKNGEHIVLDARNRLSIRVSLFETSDELGSFDFDFIEDGKNKFYKLTNMFLDLIGGYTGLGIGRQCLLFFKETTEHPVFSGYETGLDSEDNSQLTGDGPSFINKMLIEGIIQGQTNLVKQKS